MRLLPAALSAIRSLPKKELADRTIAESLTEQCGRKTFQIFWVLGGLPAIRKLSASARTPFEQVQRVSFDHESNLVKTPFERSRSRGGCYACDTLTLWAAGTSSIDFRLFLLTRSPSICCR